MTNHDAPERLYLRQTTDGLWNRTAFGGDGAVEYVPVDLTHPAVVDGRVRSIAEAVVDEIDFKLPAFSLREQKVEHFAALIAHVGQSSATRAREAARACAYAAGNYFDELFKVASRKGEPFDSAGVDIDKLTELFASAITKHLAPAGEGEPQPPDVRPSEDKVSATTKCQTCGATLVKTTNQHTFYQQMVCPNVGKGNVLGHTIIPLGYLQPIKAPSESGTQTNGETALNVFLRSSEWLKEKLSDNATCTCGCCSLCAYRYFESLTSAAGEGDAPDYCDCLMPLGSKTCHHCKKVVKPAGEGDGLRAGIEKVKAMRDRWLEAAAGDRRLGLTSTPIVLTEKADAANEIITALEALAREGDGDVK